MDITRAEQIALDDSLVAPANRIKIGKTDVLEIYMQEFWATATVHHHSIHFKMNNKKHIVNLEYFREMLQICPKLPNQQFEELPFEEAILTFLRDFGHSGEIKMITDVNVNKLHQPWRSFDAVINKCLSGYARDDHIFTTIKVISRHEDTQLYGAILPNELTNEDIRNFDSYKEYYAIASGAEPPKTKASVKKKQVRSDKTKTHLTTKVKRLKTSTKAAKPAKKKQPAKTSKDNGLKVLSKVALTEAEQMKLAIKRSLIETNSSHASGSSADEGTGSIPGVPDVPTYGSGDEQIAWKSSDEEDDDEVTLNDDDDDNDNDDDNDDDGNNDDDDDDADNQDDDDEQTDSDNDGDDFVHPKFSTHDEDKEEYSFDPRVQTPSHVESTDDEDSDEEIQEANIKRDKMNEEEKNGEAEVDALYRDVNVNLEGRDSEMTDAPGTIIQTTQVIEDTHVIITPVNPEGQQQSSSMSSGLVSNMLNPSPDTGMDSLFNLNTKSTSLVDVPVTTFAEPPLDEAQAENADFLNKLDDNIKKIIKDQVKEQVKAQVSKILPKIKKTVNEQLKAEVLTRSSNESKTSHAVATNLSELELKKILIDKMERNKSIHRSDKQRNLYKALVDAYESDKLILDTYGDTVSFKRHKNNKDKDEEPSAGSNRGSKRRRAGKELESTSAPKEKTSKTTGKLTEGSKSHHKFAGESAQAEEPMHIAKDLEEYAHQEFKTGVTEDQPNEETFQHPDWFQKPAKPTTPVHDWNKTLPDAHGPVQP
ncbi:hypothetical protein Tco_1353536 [Tanacetum coccineum]